MDSRFCYGENLEKDRMFDVKEVLNIDLFATLLLNGSKSLFLDGCVALFTSTYVWIPTMLLLIFLLYKNNRPSNFFLILAMIALTAFCCDQLSSSVFKPFFQRLRPTNNAEILHLIDTVNGYRGFKYSFISGHATNSFGVAIFLILLIKEKWFAMSLTLWALLNSLTRTYLGVHYVGDIFIGMLVGMAIGAIVYSLYRYLTRKNVRVIINYSSFKTKTGYLFKDLGLCQCFMYGTFIFIIIFTGFKQGLVPF